MTTLLLSLAFWLLTCWLLIRLFRYAGDEE
jgi:hypothetical protein